ncbi:MAG: hypothetical protein GY807_23495 [Gammaproteobacteria bacterium]|nr:hypothetical protein [Gammaproteobacteria bacterium]
MDLKGWVNEIMGSKKEVLPENNTLMGFPEIPFRMCDFYTVYFEEEMPDDVLMVGGSIPPGESVVAYFHPDPQLLKGAWRAFRLERAK